MINLAICLCFKDSAAYLEEWLLFHYVQGFRKFYLYDNESSDNYLPVLEPWQKLGLVDLTVYPGKGKQEEMYNHCLTRARTEVKWLSFIDDDEFLFPVGNESLAEILNDFEDTAGLAACWVLFGSSDQNEADAQWVISRFTRSAGAPDHHFKCVLRPDRIVRSQVVGHQFLPVEGFKVVTEKHEAQPGPQTPLPSAQRVRVNHYLIKSWEEWRARRARAEVNTGVPTPHKEPSWREWDKGWSQREDVAILRFLPEMLKVRSELLGR